MATPTPRRRKRHFTVAEANATLPLVRVIVRDISELAQELRERQERLRHVHANPRVSLGEAYQEEVRDMQTELERAQERMAEYEEELANLGVELKDYYIGLVDFRALMDGREVYLCWRLGEADVCHWHELDAGYAGRQKLMAKAAHG
jgi:hypothetical protein